MKGIRFSCCVAVFLCSMFLFLPGLLCAQDGGIPTAKIKSAFQQVLAAADKNKDGKLSMEECVAVSRDKTTMEKNCKYWDANGDGTITEEEYVQQVKKIGAKRGK
jgi:hypothetical protein